MLKIPCPEVGFEEIAIDVLQARFSTACGAGLRVVRSLGYSASRLYAVN